MASRGRPQHDEMFKPNRVAFGEVLTSEELARRMCHELQIPQRFSTRIYKAFSRVIGDALYHGEGIRIQDVGVLRLKTYNNSTTKLPTGEIIERKSMFKVIFELTKKGKTLLVNLTNKLKDSDG